MARVDRREREKAEFREEVLEAARRIVFEEGFDALTMRKIADAIEYAPGTIYLYFESRDAIAFELCRAGFEALLEALLPAAAIEDPQERLFEFGRRYVRFGMENQQTYRLIFMEDPKFASVIFMEQAEEADSPGMQALGLLVAAFAELRAQKRLAFDAEPQALAEMLWSAAHGIVSLKLTYKHVPVTDAPALLEAFNESLRVSLFNKPR